MRIRRGGALKRTAQNEKVDARYGIEDASTALQEALKYVGRGEFLLALGTCYSARKFLDGSTEILEKG